MRETTAAISDLVTTNQLQRRHRRTEKDMTHDNIIERQYQFTSGENNVSLAFSTIFSRRTDHIAIYACLLGLWLNQDSRPVTANQKPF